MRSLSQRKDSVQLRIRELLERLKSSFDALGAIEEEERRLQECDTLRCPPPAGALDG